MKHYIIQGKHGRSVRGHKENSSSKQCNEGLIRQSDTAVHTDLNGGHWCEARYVHSTSYLLKSHFTRCVTRPTAPAAYLRHTPTHSAGVDLALMTALLFVCPADLRTQQ
jgi:hypothetical protein